MAATSRENGSSYHMVSDMSLRGYQDRIARESVGKNVICMLPTGAGKTIIGAEVTRRMLEQYSEPILKFPSPNSSPLRHSPSGKMKQQMGIGANRNQGGSVLFLVPSRILVAQQAEVLRSWLNDKHNGDYIVVEYKGGDSLLPPPHDVIVSTPKAFQLAQERERARQENDENGGTRARAIYLSWESYSLVVFDEVHHCLKKHPYRNLALSIQSTKERLGCPHRPCIFGLSASLSYQFQISEIKKAIEQLCHDFLIDKLLSASEDELSVAGYTGGGVDIVVKPVDVSLIRKIEGLVPELDREPHRIAQVFISRIREEKGTSFSLALWNATLDLEAVAGWVTVDKENRKLLMKRGYSGRSYRSPITEEDVPIKKWGRHAHDYGHLHPVFTFLEHFYEGMRIQALSWEEGEDACYMFLQMMFDKTIGSIKFCQRRFEELPPETLPKSMNLPIKKMELEKMFECLSSFWEKVKGKVCMARLDSLRDILLERLTYHSCFRGIIFVDQRVVTHVLSYFISTDPKLKEHFRCACLYSSATSATASLPLSKTACKENIEQFRNGRINLLISTNVAEEGMDIPSANVVIRFDVVHTGVSLVQSRGRARHSESSFVVMKERRDRTVKDLLETERAQKDAIENFTPPKPPRSSRKENFSGSPYGSGSASNLEHLEKETKKKVANAGKIMLDKQISMRRISQTTAMQVLNEFAQVTQSTIVAECFPGNGWMCSVTCRNVHLDLSITEDYLGTSKKNAKGGAAELVLSKLLQFFNLRAL